MGFAKYQEDIFSHFMHNEALSAKATVHSEPPRDVKNKVSSQERQNKQRTMKMSSLKEFVVSTPRPIPVIVLADTSGSMSENGKIEALNQSLKEMIQTFATESRVRAEIQVGIITFGGRAAQIHLPLTPAHQIIDVVPIPAAGATPMGQAFTAVRKLLEDRQLIPSRAYRPALILVSDGLPTDDWEQSFADLQASERAQKATRFAMAIGDDADETMLGKFANDSEAPLFKAHEARDIHRFFRAVTMSVTSRTVSANPDLTAGLNLAEIPDDEVLDLDF